MSPANHPLDNAFVTTAIHLNLVPKWIMRRDPPCRHNNDEAIAKIDRFCHKLYKVPVTWLCAHACLVKYAETLKRFVHEYGDEVAIYEHGIAGMGSVDGRPEIFQPWVEQAGLKRPGADFKSKEAEAEGGMALHDMPYQDQKTALTFLKDVYDKTLGQNTRTLATSCTNQDTIRIMKELGLDISWGFCWNYFCEGMNHKASQFYPFYISSLNHTVPDQENSDRKVLAIHWGLASHTIFNHGEIHARHAGPGFCLNPLEMANRSEGLEKYDLHRKLIAQYVEYAKWNPFVHLPLQLEGIWLSEDEISKEIYDQYPTYNSANTEVLYTQIETALRLGCRPVTFATFADWHRQNVKDTAQIVYQCDDPLPDVRNRGKDREFTPLVLYGDKKRQYWFDKGRGFNYIRKYIYEPVVPEEKITSEYPFAEEPQVYLKIKHSVNLRTGICLSPDRAFYEVSEFDLSAYHDDPNYAAVLWQANIPAYVKDADIQIGGAVKEFKTIREKNLAILFADLKKGFNPIVFRSDLPGKFIRQIASEKVGKRWEIWYQNDADEAVVQRVDAVLAPGLRIGGFWWDGHYHRTIHRFGMSWYDTESGKLFLPVYYPAGLTLNRGLTRLSIELL